MSGYGRTSFLPTKKKLKSTTQRRSSRRSSPQRQASRRSSTRALNTRFRISSTRALNTRFRSISTGISTAPDTCSIIFSLCQTNSALKELCSDDNFWRVACEIRTYDREDRTSGFHQLVEGPLKWKKQFNKWCKLCFPSDGRELKNKVDELLRTDGSGSRHLDPYGPIGSWDVSKVTDMGAMFRSAVHFNQSLDSWDVSKVTDMGHMFRGALEFNQSLDSWVYVRDWQQSATVSWQKIFLPYLNNQVCQKENTHDPNFHRFEREEVNNKKMLGH